MTTPVTPYTRLSALIIDDHSSQRQQLRWHLAQMGMTSIEQAATAQEAINKMEKKSYDLILCDYNLDSTARGIVSNGQQLLEHANSLGIITPATIFMMVSGNNTFSDIAATLEHSPDAYLVKPLTTRMLQERLQRLMERQTALAPITDRVRVKDYAGAIKASDKVLAENPDYLVNALRLKGNTQLELGLFEDASATFGKALKISFKLDWAHYGKARAMKGLGQIEDAKMFLEDLLSRNGLYASAYELLAEISEEQGKPEEAVKVLKRSLEVLPSPRRSRALAEAAYRVGDVDTARQHFEIAMRATKGTFVGQLTDVLMVAQAAVDMGDNEVALRVVRENSRELAQSSETEGASFAVQAQAYAATGNVNAARDAATRAANTVATSDSSLSNILVAKGLLSVGDKSGVDRIKESIKGDHENAQVIGLALRALKDTGHEQEAEAIVTATVGAVRSLVTESLSLRRTGSFQDAKVLVDKAVAEMPNNTGILLEASQVYLMALMRQPVKDREMVTTVVDFLSKLGKLLPGNQRVAAQQSYFRKVMTAAAPAPVAAPAITRVAAPMPELAMAA